MRNVRNFAIIALAALVVVVVPGGAATSSGIYGFLAAMLGIATVFLANRLYRERRIDIYGLGDQHRAVLYGALVLIVLTLAASDRLLENGEGDLLFGALLALAGGALLFVYRAWREY